MSNPRPKPSDKKYLSVPTEYRHDTMTGIQVHSKIFSVRKTDRHYISYIVINMIGLIVGCCGVKGGKVDYFNLSILS